LNAVLQRSFFAAILSAVGLAAAACSSSSSSAATAAATPTTSPATTAASTPAQSATDTSPGTPAAGGGECGTASTAAGTVLTGNSDVKSFEIGAGCDVTITTGLSSVGDPKAINLCDAAGKVAYLVGAKSVTVLGVGNTELAIGVKGQPCIRG
jgi:hypothetical protein